MKIVAGVDGSDEALAPCHFKNPVAVTILSVVPSLAMVEPNLMIGLSEEHNRQAQQIVNDRRSGVSRPGLHGIDKCPPE